MGGAEVAESSLLEGLDLYQAILVLLLLGALRLGFRPWGPGYHARFPERYDILSTGFAMTSAGAAEAVHLLDKLPEAFKPEPTGITHILNGYGWMAASGNEEIRQTGLLLMDICREAEASLPVPLKPRR